MDKQTKKRKFRVPLPPMPTKKYKITVMPGGQVFEVDPKEIPYGRNGLPGSILDIINSKEDGLIEHTCGGVQACSTCHVYVVEGYDICNESSEREEDYLEKNPSLQLNSRLSCCCVPDGSSDIVIKIPKWKKNEVNETPH